MSEWLLNDHTLPTTPRWINTAPTLTFGHQSSSINLHNDWFVEIRRHRKVKEDVSACTRLGIECMDGADNSGPCLGSGRVTSEVMNALCKSLPCSFFKVIAKRSASIACKFTAELVIGLWAPADPKDLRARINGTAPVHFIERGNQLSVRQVS